MIYYYYCLVYPNGAFVGKDQHSGGYPYRVIGGDIRYAWLETNSRSFDKYIEMFKSENFSIREVRIEVGHID